MADLPHVFISYKSEEREQADGVRSILESEEIPVWMAPESIDGGENYPTAIGKAIKNCGCVLYMLSKRSQESIWIQKEIEMALGLGKTVVPLNIDNCELNDTFRFMIGNCQIENVKLISPSDFGVSRGIYSIKKEIGYKQEKKQTQIKYFNYRIINDKECEITKFLAEEKTVVIPSEIRKEDGSKYSVTSIGDRVFSGCISLTSIEIPSSVTRIGDNAFERCSCLTNIEIPESVTRIGDSAFSNCSSLTSIEIPSSVTSIGKDGFSKCRSLTSIEIPESVTRIGDSAFSWCSSLTSIEIPSSVTSIGFSAFSGCRSLTSIEIHANVTSIGFSAFWGCSSLKSIVIPSNVKINKDVFFLCDKLNIFSKERKKPRYWKWGWNPEKRPVYYEGEWEYVNGVPTPKK